MLVEDCFKIYNLRLSKVQWVLFGIDVVKKKCFVVEIVRNYCSDTRILQIDDGRALWRKLLKKGYENITIKKAGHIPTVVFQRIKEWNSFAFNEFNGWKKKRRLNDPWILRRNITDSEENLDKIGSNFLKNSKSTGLADPWEENLQNIDYQDGRVSERLEEFGDFDNYWNQEGVFEKETDIDPNINHSFSSYTYQNNNYDGSISEYKTNLNIDKLINYKDINNKNDEEVNILKEVENLINSRNYEEGLRKINKLLDKNNSLEKGYICRGFIKSKINDQKGAIEDYTNALEINSKNEKSYLDRGYLKAISKDHISAIEDYSKALEINPKNINTLFYRGFSRSELNDQIGAIKDYTSAIEINPNLENAYVNRGVAKSNLKDDYGAIEDYSKAININPKNKTALHNRGLRRASLSFFSEAIVDYSRAIEIDPKFYLAFMDRGYSKIELNDYLGAIKDYSKALEINPNNSNSLFYRGYSKAELNDHIGAIEDYSKAIDINPKNPVIFFKRGFQKLTLKFYEEAIKDFNSALLIDPYYEEAYFNRGVSRTNISAHEGAIADYTTVIELNPKNELCFIYRGYSKSELKDHLGAIEDYSKAIDINQKDPKTFFSRGMSNLYLEMYDNAFRDFDNGLRLDPNNLEFLYLAGMIKYELGDIDSCVRYLGKIIELNKNYRDVADFLSKLELNQKQEDLSKGKEVNQKINKNIEKDKESNNNQTLDEKKSRTFIDLNLMKGEIKKFINSPKIKNIKNKISNIENRLIKKEYTYESKSISKELDNQEGKEDLTKLLNNLESYIGLESVKNEINKIVNFQKINNERIKLGLVSENYSKHMVFYGPPGTGKSEIARLVGRIFNSLGVLSKGHFIETDRSSLIAGHVGQTAIKTKNILEMAKGGILFIDEAYTLTKNQENFDFGSEAISVILKFMEDYRDDLVVIVAGYEDEMNSFLQTNPGLKSRFNSFLYFPNYTEKELLEILIKLSNDRGYFIKHQSRESLKNDLAKISEFKNSQFGNARSMRNLLELAIKNQASRILKNEGRKIEDYQSLVREDFILSDEQYSNL